ncbi:MAG: glycosyltransferase [Sphaerochaeta sp.]|nr:glycosyltransferase [Sphaerochaeta sp.]
MLKKIMRFFFRIIFSRDFIINKGFSKNAVVSYLPEVFRIKSKRYYFSHQNREENLIIVSTLVSLGYNVRIIRFNKAINNISEKIDLVIGLEPNFELLCHTFPKAIKIYYATGSYYSFQNIMIESRTNSFNKKYGFSISENRKVSEHLSSELADYILQVGNHHTMKTYPKEVQSKIHLIKQACHNFEGPLQNEKKDRNRFLWLGSSGSLLKGLDILLEVFSSRADVCLDIVGTIDSDFYELYAKKIIMNSKNIEFHGFLDIWGKKFKHIYECCSYSIFPSFSEGYPGSVVNTMKLGLLPIVSSVAAEPFIIENGIVLDTISENSIRKAIDLAIHIDNEEYEIKTSQICMISREKYSVLNYSKNIKDLLSKMVK